MKVDVSTLNNSISKMQQARSILSESRSILSSINIPGDFPEGGTISSAAGQISNAESLLVQSEQSAANSISSFNATIANNNQIIDNLFGSMLAGIDIGLKGKSSESKTTKSNKKSETSNIFGIKTYMPGENSVDRRLVRKFKWNRWHTG